MDVCTDRNPLDVELEKVDGRIDDELFFLVCFYLHFEDVRDDHEQGVRTSGDAADARETVCATPGFGPLGLQQQDLQRSTTRAHESFQQPLLVIDGSVLHEPHVTRPEGLQIREIGVGPICTKFVFVKGLLDYFVVEPNAWSPLDRRKESDRRKIRMQSLLDNGSQSWWSEGFLTSVPVLVRR